MNIKYLNLSLFVLFFSGFLRGSYAYQDLLTEAIEYPGDCLSRALVSKEEAEKLKKISRWGDEVFSYLQLVLIDEKGNFDNKKAKQLGAFVNTSSSLYPRTFHSGINETKRGFSKFTIDSNSFLFYYMYAPGGNWRGQKELILFEKYILPYCASKNPFTLLNLFIESRKNNRKSIKNLPVMQGALFFYIIQISLLYYILPVGSLGFLGYKYHQNPQIFQLWLEKLRKLLPSS